jgi:hypothetical protein
LKSSGAAANATASKTEVDSGEERRPKWPKREATK